MTLSVTVAARSQPCSMAYSAIAAPSSWATLPSENASLPWSPKRSGPIWSVPMHGATASTPRVIASCTAGVAKSTSQVTSSTSAPPSMSSIAADFVRSGSSWWSMTRSWSWRPSTPPSSLILSTWISAAVTAGPSKGAICPVRSTAAPITIGSSVASSPPPPVSAATSPPSPSSSSSPPQAATASPNANRRASSRLHLLIPLMPNSSRPFVFDPAPPPGPGLLPETTLPFPSRGGTWSCAGGPGRPGHPLALVHQLVHEVPEVGGLLLAGEEPHVPELRERGHGVHRRVEDELRPLRRQQVGEGLRLEARVEEEPLHLADPLVRRTRARVRAQPRGRVELVLDVRVVVAVAAHEGHGRDDLPVAVTPHDLLGAEAVLDRHHGRVGGVTGECRRRGAKLCGLRGQDHQVEPGQLGRVGGRPQARGEVVLPGDPEAPLLEGARVPGAPRQHPDVGDRREVGRVEAADDAAAHDADALRHVLASTAARSHCCRKASRPRRTSSPGSSGQSESGYADPKVPSSEKTSSS